MSPDQAMSQVDANKDGAITLQEQVDYASRDADMRFSRMDQDKDGRLTSQELATAEKRRQSMQKSSPSNTDGNGNQPSFGSQSLLAKADTNQDGQIDSSENREQAQQQATRRFQFSDKNKDGRLDRDELQTKPQMPRQN